MPAPRKTTTTIAAVQATPVFLDRDKTVDKACKLIAEAARKGAKLAVFPEAFIPTYPDWIWAVPASNVGLHRQMHTHLVNNAVKVPSAATEKLCRAARRAKLNVVIGINEVNTEASGTTLYNTILYISEAGEIVGKHRKLVPTGPERMVWGQGDGSTLSAYDLPVGRVGGLICWENYMPLARFAMYAWGTQVYVAPTWDRGDMWRTTIRHIAKEGGVYVIGCCIALRKKDIPEQYGLKVYYTSAPEWVNVGDSAIVDPDGQFVAGPVQQEESILYAEADLAGLPGPKWMFDVAGHYARPDVFQLIVDRNTRPIVTPGASDGVGPARQPAGRPASQARRQASQPQRQSGGQTSRPTPQRQRRTTRR